MAEYGKKVDAWINPLLFISLDPLLRKAAGNTSEVSATALLSDLTRNHTADPVLAITDRYNEISKFDRLLQIVPVDNLILSKIVWPLRSAKQAYMLGDNLGCIALCGCIGEMVASLTFQFIGLRLGQIPMTSALERQLLGAPFEKLNQSRRVEVLRALGAWTDDQAKKAGELAKIRNKHLHRLSADVNYMEREAMQVYSLAIELAAGAVAFRIGDKGTVVVEEKLGRYLLGKTPRS